MKKILFLLAFVPLLFSCSSNDDNSDSGFSMTQVTKEQLESGTGTFVMTKATKEYYLSFKGNLMYFTYNGYEISDLSFKDYSINGDSITIGDSKLYIQMVNWGTPKTSATGTGGIQLLIRGNNLPYGMKEGYYDSSVLNPRDE